MNHIFDKLPALVNEELEAANKEHGKFHSYHEGYAVLLEELDETKAELDEVQRYTDYLWGHVKGDNAEAVQHFAARIKTCAERMAAEAIQVAAMALKIRNMGDEREGWR